MHVYSVGLTITLEPVITYLTKLTVFFCFFVIAQFIDNRSYELYILCGYSHNNLWKFLNYFYREV